jgi:hypothetical protein
MRRAATFCGEQRLVQRFLYRVHSFVLDSGASLTKSPKESCFTHPTFDSMAPTDLRADGTRLKLLQQIVSASC